MVILTKELEDDFLVERKELKKAIPSSVLDKLNNSQLWYIYLALKRINLVPELKEGTDKLANCIYKYGVRTRSWG